MSFSREIVSALVLGVIALLVGIPTGTTGWALFIGSLLWIALQVLEFRKLSRWSGQPLTTPPNASPSWYNVSITPYRLLQRERGRSRRFLARMREVLGLVEVIPDAVIIMTPSGEIENFNAAASDLLNLNHDDLGLTLASVVRNPHFVAMLREEADDTLIEFTSPLDSDKTLEARLFHVEGGRIVVIVRDISELNRLLTMRQSFVANVSHELRTPLTVVAGYLEIIVDEQQDADLRLGLVNKLTSPLARIRSLVEDLLLLSRLESTPMPAQLDPISMHAMIQSAVNEVNGIAHSPEQISVHCTSTQTVPGLEQELYSVCVNLLSNAIRYSPEGTPVKVSWEEVEPGLSRLSVEDGGVGIAPEHISRITERFYRVDMADARTRGGTGLGLAIVKHVLRRHDSELKVESTLGEGSTFFCEFRSPEAHPVQAIL
ncbi:MAG: phosphate regulon sensor histidine kinase PhoR [Pseudomonadota bacterium]